jgi:hypothetical protein
MKPLDDDELNSLLEQAKSSRLEPSWTLAARALRAYRANFARPRWRRHLLQPIPIPWPLALLATIVFVWFGVLGDQSFRRVSASGEGRNLAPAHYIYGNCPTEEHAPSQSTAILTFKEFQPVSQIKPRVVRSLRNDE